MTKLVVVINGRPRSGKDTAVKFMMEALIHKGVATWTMSSIDPVRELLAPVSDLSAKTEADRRLLAEVGRAVENHSDWRTRQVVQFAATLFHQAGDEPAVLFVHMREPDLILKLKGMIGRDIPQADFITVFVARPDATPVTSNAADAGVEGMSYNHCLFNGGTLDDLRCAATTLAGELFLKEAA